MAVLLKASRGSTWIVLVYCLVTFGFVSSVEARTAGLVTKVYDGDTVLLADGRKVRYLGINAPEFGQPFYWKAKRLNAELVLGQEIHLEFDGDQRDGRDRLLAYVFAGPVLVNGVLIEQGLAHAFFLKDHLRYAERFLGLQEQARGRRAGMWTIYSDSPLKITRVFPGRDSSGPQRDFYVRIVNLRAEPVALKNYVVMNEDARRFRFPHGSLEPGETVLIVGDKKGKGNRIRQLVLQWETDGPVWDQREDTALLFDPSERLIDQFHYRRSHQSDQRRD